MKSTSFKDSLSYFYFGKSIFTMMVPVVGPDEVGTEEIGPEVVSDEITFAGAVGLPDGGVTASAAARLTVPVFVIEEFLAAVCCGFVVSKSEMSAD